MSKVMNHEQYIKSLKGKTEDELRFIMQDAKEAAEAMPTGENVGYYLDEVLYANAELRRRSKGDDIVGLLNRKIEALALDNTMVAIKGDNPKVPYIIRSKGDNVFYATRYDVAEAFILGYFAQAKGK